MTLYSASRGVDAVRKALNLAYDVKESRPLWKTEGIAFGMTLGGALLVLLGVAALVAGGDVGLVAGRAPGLRHGVRRHLELGAVAGHGRRHHVRAPPIGYYLLPDVVQEFRFITPGSIFGTLVWLAATWGFSFYAGHFGSYNVTYGSIGGVIVLMTWLYISGFVFLMGGEINAILEDHDPEGKALGARAPGEAPPPPRSGRARCRRARPSGPAPPRTRRAARRPPRRPRRNRHVH